MLYPRQPSTAQNVEIMSHSGGCCKQDQQMKPPHNFIDVQNVGTRGEITLDFHSFPFKISIAPVSLCTAMNLIWDCLLPILINEFREMFKISIATKRSPFN